MCRKLIFVTSFVLVLVLTGFTQAELLSNPGFEADLEGWKTWGGGSGSGAGGWFYNSDTHATVMEDGTAQSGDKYVEVGIADMEGSWWAVSLVFQEHPVIEGKTYEISGWLRDGDAEGEPSLIAEGGMLQWEWRDAAPGEGTDTDDRGDLVERVSHNFDLTEEWTYHTASEVAPPGANGATIIFGTTWGGINLDVDDASFVKVIPPLTGLYAWNGSAEDGLWDTAANWTVTDSNFTWPNEENAADPNLAAYINSDVLAIDIIDGGAVTREDTLRIKGTELETAVLTLDNGSSLTVSGRLSIGTNPDGEAVSGQLDVLGGSTVTILDGENGNDLYLTDDDGTSGTINIVDSTVDVFDDIIIDQGEGTINISGSSIIIADRINIGNNAGAVGTLNISGTTTVDLVDDLKTDEGEGHINISGDAVVSFGDDGYIPDHEGTAFATLDINGNATVNVGDDLDVGEDGPAICNVGDDATLIVEDTIYIPHHQQGIEATMTISGNATVTCNDLQVVNDGGNTGYLEISGNPTITANEFLMNNDEGDPGTSEVTMNGGTLTVNGNSTINDDNNGTAKFTMNGGRFYTSGYLNISDNLDGTALLTMNGGEVITADRLRIGKDGGEDTGQVRIMMNGGVLQRRRIPYR
jgi:hypothetical protein